MLAEYGLEAPPWRAPLRGISADKKGSTSGYPDIYETFSTQAEDRLNESNVKEGFAGEAYVQSEGFSAHTMIHEKLANNGVLSDLAQLVANVQRIRNEKMGGTGDHTFEPPGRTTLTQGKLDAWVNDIANPAVPLVKLAKNSLPRGYTNDKLLELLTSKKLPIDRAVWYIRATGASDIRATLPQDSERVEKYTREWTAVVCEYMKKLLNEIVLPTMVTSAARVAVKGKVKATLTDPILRQSWGSRFGYLTMLVRQLYSEGLLAADTFLEWQVVQLKSAHFGQLPFVLHVVEAYIDEHIESGHLTKGIVETCVSRLKDARRSSALEQLADQIAQIEADSQSAHLEDVRFAIRHLLEPLLVLRPSAFVQPSIWLATADQIRQCFRVPLNRPALLGVEVALINKAVRDNVDTCSQKAHVLLCEPCDGQKASIASSRLKLIEILDKVRFPCDLEEQSELFFSASSPPFADRLGVLLTWATAPTRNSPSQPYVAAAILRSWCNRHTRALAQLQSQLEMWLDRPAASHDTDRCLRLYKELIRVKIFSFNRYYDTMVASGETEVPSRGPQSLHQRLIRCLPRDGLQTSSRRRVMSQEEEDERNALHQVQEGLSSLCGGSDSAEIRQMRQCLRALKSSEMQQQASVGIVGAVMGQESLSPNVFVNGVCMLEVLQDYSALAKLCIDGLAQVDHSDVVLLIADTISIHMDVWTALGICPDLTEALMRAHDRLYSRQLWPSSATRLMLEFGQHDICSSDVRRTLHGVLPRPLIQPSVSDEDAAAHLDGLFALVGSETSDAIAQRALHLFGNTSQEWLNAFLSEGLVRMEAESLSAEAFIDLLTALNEIAQLDVGDAVLAQIAAMTLPEALLHDLVTTNVVSLPLLLRRCLLPRLQSALSAIPAGEAADSAQFLRLAASCMQLLAKLVASLAVSSGGVAQLHLRARWRLLLTTDAFQDLCRALAYAILCEATAKGISNTACKDARLALMGVDELRQAMLRQGVDALSAFFDVSKMYAAPLKTEFLVEVTGWVATFDKTLRSSSQPITPLEMWSLLPTDVAEWHMALIRLDMQLYLEKSSLASESQSEQDVFLQRLMLNSDPAMAEGLLQSFSQNETEKLFEALSIRTCVGLAGRDLVDDESWLRLTSLCDLLLRNVEPVTLRSLSLSSATLHTLLERILECLREGASGDNLSRVLFALCMSLRCKDVLSDGLSKTLGEIGAELVRAQERLAQSHLATQLQDVLSFLLDTFPPATLVWRVVRQESITSQCAELAWLTCTAPQVNVTEPLQISPWELYEVAPLPGNNSSSIDLHQLNGSIIATGLSGKQKPDSTPDWTNHAGSGQGMQSRFDSEWPIAREGVPSRDFRRGILDEAAQPSQNAQPKEVIDVDETDPAPRGALKRKPTDDGKQPAKKIALPSGTSKLPQKK